MQSEQHKYRTCVHDLHFFLALSVFSERSVFAFQTATSIREFPNFSTVETVFVNEAQVLVTNLTNIEKQPKPEKNYEFLNLSRAV